jgi:hypothetical protein
MHISDPYVYGIVVAVVSSAATIVASSIARRASRSSAATALDGIARQIDFQARAKIAEFRQAWINELRVQMASLQSIGVTPGIEHQSKREFYKAGTMIELLMNHDDPCYAELQRSMYDFLEARTIDEKFACNPPFVHVCQEILKTEWETLKHDLGGFPL